MTSNYFNPIHIHAVTYASIVALMNTLKISYVMTLVKGALLKL